ncbi:MAG TPA: SRPBCC domain-containing protein [bacterium]|nr:SRPBCC domain-containing protein [bacterium]
MNSRPLTLNLRRVIAGPPAEVYRAWLDPRKPVNPWSVGRTLGFPPKAGNLYCVLVEGTAYIFGRVLKLSKGKEFRFTWMSPYTHGAETRVTVRFQKRAGGTLLTLRHTGLPNDKDGRLHAQGWNQFLVKLETHFGQKAR